MKSQSTQLAGQQVDVKSGNQFTSKQFDSPSSASLESQVETKIMSSFNYGSKVGNQTSEKKPIDGSKVITSEIIPSHDMLEHHKKMSELHQKRLEIAKQELSKSIMIVQGLSVVVRYLTENYEAFNNPALKDELSILSDKLDRSDHQFKCQEQAMSRLKSEYLASESQLRDEVRRIQSDLNDAETRHENEKMNLIASFQLEMDAARKRFEADLAKIQAVKNELQKLNNQFREQLRHRDSEVSFS